MGKKKIISFAAAFIAAAQALTSVTATGIADDAGIVEYASSDAEVSLPDNDELFAMYYEKLLYGDFSFFADYGSHNLKGSTLAAYEKLKDWVEKVAKGEIATTEFTYTPQGYTYTSLQELFDDVMLARDYVMLDFPQMFFWYDKTKETKGKGTSKTVTVSFTVAADYSATGAASYEVDTAKLTAANTSVENAQSIIAKYADSSMQDKVMGFKNEICKLTDYNHPAADSGWTGTNPWQMIWVFDGDPDTKVVCEGYSKAFQYLCDMSAVDCYTVTGVMKGGTGEGGHMWNIVTMDDDKNYLVDVTNCDNNDGNKGTSHEYLILKGAKESSASGCTMQYGAGTLTYKYYSGESGHMNTTAIYPASLLTVSTTDYVPVCGHKNVTAWTDNGDGKHTATCPDCSETITEAHKTGKFKSDAEYHWKECTVCAAKLDKAAHTFGAVSEGVQTCTKCGYEKTHEHTYGDPVVTEPTCGKPGSKVYKCSECGDTKTEEIPATGEHTYTYKSDKTSHWQLCSVCKKTTEHEAHTWNEGVVTTEPTCTEDGEKTFTCTVCMATDKKPVDAVGHKYGTAWESDETGHWHKCLNTGCDKTKDKTDHEWGDPVVTTEPTCTEPGEQTVTCTECGFEKTEELAPAHKFDDKWEITDDTHKNVCTECGKGVEEKHDYSKKEVTKKPTCTEPGEATLTCICGKTTVEEIEELGHLPGDPVRENVVEATATKDGSYDKVVYCERCEKELSRDTVIIPMTGEIDPPIEPLPDDPTPDTSEPDTSEPDTSEPDTSEPDTSEPDKPDTSEPDNSEKTDAPFIKDGSGKDGWDAIDDVITDAKDKDVVTIDMNRSTTVPKNIFEAAKGKDITVVFELGNISWSVAGTSVGSAADIDFAVTTGVNVIPADVTATIQGEAVFTQLRLAHDGDFGFTALLKLDMGTSNAGKTAGLYYYNGSKLEKTAAEKISADGVVKLPFAHASDYLVTVYEENTAPGIENESVEAPETNPGSNPSTGSRSSIAWLAALSCIVLTAPVFKRKRSGK